MVILFRKSLEQEGEFQIAQKHLQVVESRLEVPPGSTVIGRYSVLPYYEELEADLVRNDSRLINLYQQHRYIADFHWYDRLKNYTPKTWFSLESVLADDYSGPYVVKGKTNSRKFLWNSHMFAKDKSDLRLVAFRLLDDSMIGSQGLIFRKFENFKNYGESLTGPPISKEFRFFILNGKIVDSGFYWSCFPEVVDKYNPQPGEVPQDFLDEIVELMGDLGFWVLDVAQREDGSWRVVELNDAQMSGLSCIEPESFYRNIAKILKN